jgi:hypothetical protein
MDETLIKIIYALTQFKDKRVRGLTSPGKKYIWNAIDPFQRVAKDLKSVRNYSLK